MESFFTNLKKEVQCSLCEHTLTDPKLLQCFHTFCKPCIQRHAQLKEQVHIFKCPKCSSETLLQELSNVEDLQPSPLHTRMLQVLAFSESDKSCSVSETHSPALWHCLDCDRSLCDECLKCHTTFTKSFTKDHQIVSLTDVKKEDLESMLRKENPCKTHLNSNIEFFCKDCDVLICLLCLKDDHKDHKTLTLVDGCKEFTYDPYKPDTAGIVFSPDEDMDREVNNVKLGNVRPSCKSNPIFSEIEATNSNLRALKKAMLSVVTKTSTGDVNYDDCDVVDIQINPADDVKVEEKTVKTDGKIEVEFMPRVPGQLTVDVKLNGIPVSNSPVMKNVEQEHLSEKQYQNHKLINALNTTSGDFKGVAANKDYSRIAVADFSLDCVRVFNMDGELLLMYGGKGSQQGQLLNPEGLAFLNDVELVIVDYGNNRLCVVNTVTGTLVKTFGCQGNGNGEFSNPRGVHVDDDGNIIVTDTDNGRVQVFTKDGDYQYQFTVPNQDDFIPFSTVTHNGLFYVSDSNNGVIHVIQMKDGSPTRMSTIGEKGDGVGEDPSGLVIDNNSNLLVCDGESNVIKKFTLDGRFVGQTSTLKEAPYYIEVLNDGQCICSLEEGLTIFKH